MKVNKELLNRLYVYKHNLESQLANLNMVKDFPAKGSDYEVHKNTIEIKGQQLSMLNSIIDLYLLGFNS